MSATNKVYRRRRRGGAATTRPDVVYQTRGDDFVDGEQQEQRRGGGGLGWDGVRPPDGVRHEQLLGGGEDTPREDEFDEQDADLYRAIQESLRSFESQYQRPFSAPAAPPAPEPKYRDLTPSERRCLDFLRSRWRLCVPKGEEGSCYPLQIEQYVSELLQDGEVGRMPTALCSECVQWFTDTFGKHPLFHRLIPFLSDPRDWRRVDERSSGSDRSRLGDMSSLP